MGFASKFDAAATRFAKRAAFAFPDTCAVQSPTNTQGSSGGNKPSWGDVTGLASVPCLYRSRGGAERDAAGAVTAFTGFEILMPSEVSGVAVTVAPKHRIVVASRGTQPARTFEVVSVANEAGAILRAQVVQRN